MLDQHGYPTEETLETIEKWDYISTGPVPLLEYVVENWNYGIHESWFKAETFSLATGGWSGNEDVLEALRNNFLFWAMHWDSSHRGGKVVFHLTRQQMKELKERLL